jgi:excisionase family DNA binding protein
VKAELVISKELVKEIASEVAEHLKPMLSSNGKHEIKDKLLTPDELAKLLTVKKPQIYAWVNESKYTEDGIPFLKAGKFLRFSQGAVFKWMQKHKNTVEDW